MSKTNLACIVYVICKGKLLLLKRSENSPLHPNLWCFPGGKVEPGEHVLTAAYRELKEETGLPTTELFFMYRYGSPSLERPSYTVSVYVTEHFTIPKVILSKEHSDYGWYTIEEACKLPLSGNTLTVLKTIQLLKNPSYALLRS